MMRSLEVVELHEPVKAATERRPIHPLRSSSPTTGRSVQVLDHHPDRDVAPTLAQRLLFVAVCCITGLAQRLPDEARERVGLVDWDENVPRRTRSRSREARSVCFDGSLGGGGTRIA